MKRVLQTNDWNCLAAVAAMITGEEIGAVFEDAGHDGSGFVGDTMYRRGFRFCEIVRYLAGRGFVLGAYSDGRGGYIDTKAVTMHIWVEIAVQRPALLIVRSRLESLRGLSHAVLWTGREVLDPNPARLDSEDLARYEVLEWWPITKIEG